MEFAAALTLFDSFVLHTSNRVRERERLFVDVAYDSIDKTGPIYKIRNNLNSMHAQPIPLEMDWLMKQWNERTV